MATTPVSAALTLSAGVHVLRVEAVSGGSFTLSPITIAGDADDIAGSTAGTSSASGTLAGTVALAGAAAGTSVNTGTVSVDLGEQLIGASHGVATVTATMQALVPILAGSSAGAATVTANAVGGITRIVGSSAGVATATGTPSLQLTQIGGSAVGRGACLATVAVLDQSGLLAGSAAGQAYVAGLMGATVRLSGSSAGRAVASARMKEPIKAINRAGAQSQQRTSFGLRLKKVTNALGGDRKVSVHFGRKK